MANAAVVVTGKHGSVFVAGQHLKIYLPFVVRGSDSDDAVLGKAKLGIMKLGVE